jgi:hypothetical protein
VRERDFIQVHGQLRGERVTVPLPGAPPVTFWLLHDFIADDGAEFDIKSSVTEYGAKAIARSANQNDVKAEAQGA